MSLYFSVVRFCGFSVPGAFRSLEMCLNRQIEGQMRFTGGTKRFVLFTRSVCSDIGLKQCIVIEQIGSRTVTGAVTTLSIAHTPYKLLWLC